MLSRGMTRESPAPPARTPGCTDRCRVEWALRPGLLGRVELLLHDAASHEEYGAWLAGPGRSDAPWRIVTGPLTVDLRRYEVVVDERVLHLTPTEMRILSALARRAGALVAHGALIADVWGEAWLAGTTTESMHVVRANMTRLRSALGTARGLIATVSGVGYRLELIEPGAASPGAPAYARQARARSGWSLAYERCRACGTTERAHSGHGYCIVCLRRTHGEATPTPTPTPTGVRP